MIFVNLKSIYDEERCGSEKVQMPSRSASKIPQEKHIETHAHE